MTTQAQDVPLRFRNRDGTYGIYFPVNRYTGKPSYLEFLSVLTGGDGKPSHVVWLDGPEAEQGVPMCDHCEEKLATCLGCSDWNCAYACDDCCGHGNEYCWCIPLVEIPERVKNLYVWIGNLEDRIEKLHRQYEVQSPAPTPSVPEIELPEPNQHGNYVWPDGSNIWRTFHGWYADSARTDLPLNQIFTTLQFAARALLVLGVGPGAGKKTEAQAASIVGPDGKGAATGVDPVSVREPQSSLTYLLNAPSGRAAAQAWNPIAEELADTLPADSPVAEAGEEKAINIRVDLDKLEIALRYECENKLTKHWSLLAIAELRAVRAREGQ